MNDKTALLNQLRIERDSAPPPSGKGRLLAIAAALLAMAAAAAWIWLRPAAIPVHVVAAQATS